MKLFCSLFIFLFFYNLSVEAQIVCTANDREQWDEIKLLAQKNPETLWETIGTYFLGRDYVANTLEVDADSSLVINLNDLDCTTYVEYVIASVLTLRNNPNAQFDDFAKSLEFLRYRNGKRNGYPSRLHYFSEWLSNNTKKNIITPVKGDFFKNKKLNLDFMSTHRSAYKYLQDDSFFEAIKQIEQQFKPSFLVLAKNEISKAEKDLKHGDVVALVTSIKGLDVTHTGFIFKMNGVSHLLHASSKSNKVEISSVPLQDYIQNNKSVEGITVYRLN